MVGTHAFTHFRFGTFRDSSITQTEALTACMSFDAEKDNLYLQGPVGVGKTHLAVATILGHYDAAAGSVAFEKPYSFNRYMRNRTAREEEDIIDGLARKHIFVLDDLGLSKASDFTLERLYELIDKRIQNGRNGLVITSNLTFDDINKKTGDDRLTSRLNGMCRVIRIVGNDARFQASIERLPF